MNVKESVGDRNRNGIKNKPVNGVGSEKFIENGELEDDDETKSLLSPRKGGLAKKSAKPRRKVQWNDKNGNKLAEVLEYQPSDSSDSDEEDDSDPCSCRIM